MNILLILCSTSSLALSCKYTHGFDKMFGVLNKNNQNLSLIIIPSVCLSVFLLIFLSLIAVA